MRRINFVFLIPLLLSCLLIACGDGSDQNPISISTGRLKISLTDATADFDAVNITFSEVSAHINDEWINLSGEEQTVNLLEFSNGRTVEIGSADVPVGDYTQIRLKISEAEVVVEGQSQPVTVPSGTQTGLKLVTQFSIGEGTTVELIVDFDANRSIVTTGPPNNPMSYILKPTLRVTARAPTGSISGTVANPENLPLAFALADGDTITSTPIDTTTGQFMLAFLPEGLYDVSVSDTLNYSAVMSNVPVTTGTTNDIGTLTLLSPSESQAGNLKRMQQETLKRSTLPSRR
ncbi:DUF4382 domain-containing protein [candidate division KSB1 bacterium]|nr:DUF4382 domain-containing protein [candidate division KSB1 bacterium]NIR68772.1 DUF4382 domain-containing protein [candidate division KSB1 bacterium]NIS24010.1 DUF4382 domain-containing protein [candidate division KSB1 bacterium]NIT70937.1 DUF4382 domain-containing protein [candidate division KSB1 bacterium]NIU24658.1 DUF4382 domain-containing protein [candidate division KSB1 bacterium]